MPHPHDSQIQHSELFDKAADSLLAAIVDSSDDAIVSKDLDGLVMSWNKSAERIFGYTAEEMIGRPISLVIPADRIAEEPQILERLRRGERVDHYETIRVRKGGQHFDVSLTISPVKDSTGKIIGASKVARDISEQKKNRRMLEETNEALKRSDRIKAEFLATLSHELRTPLNAIVGWIQILKDGVESPEELEEGLKVIDRNTRAQIQLIEDLLDMSRIESGKVTLDLQPLDPVSVVNAALDSARPAAKAKQLQISSSYGSVNGVITGDRHRLQQVVWNLLTNAIKFTPPGGRIHIRTERAHPNVEISITDSGQGIAPDLLGHVFERFRQGDSSTTRRYGGLGIGLSIAKQLTELHGGEIRVKSEGEGKGSMFIVSIPLVTATPPRESLVRLRDSAADLSLSGDDLAGIRVLVIDDERDSADITLRILRGNHAEVQTADSVEGGLAAFESFRPHVIMSDIGMPGMDGYDFMERLRKLPAGKTVPVVALTAMARSEDRTRSLRAGFQMHLAKPADARELTAVVRNLASTARTEP